ncbi:hypothetical protein [Flavisolibacter ginsenosidimutans]|jgi:hypothetical protein|uniref:Uncharacterized protein n=1 Tax=Flavisolibacter ginsenosidimutans TaxID=661481 RepID=A0A5B8UJJ4_9BACT|nr:hypothetical protein [Flavisolibacter ginsenosidimutans]QEC56572.1 hypothetical protein FSB75_11935 [Flavisolibacter ginsenosidimutans]
MAQSAPATNLINDGAVIRIEKNGKTLLVAKDQVKTIDTVHDNIVRIDIGEGPLKNIFLNYQEVSNPVVASANELRDTIKAMMVTDAYLGGDAKEVTQIAILNQVSQLTNVLVAINNRELKVTADEPSRTDESNPYTIYRGWHSRFGIPDQQEWAIERIRRDGDEIISEWAFGTKRAIYPWTERETLNYVPYDHDLPIESPLPILPDYNPPAEGPGGPVGDSNPPVYQPVE